MYESVKKYHGFYIGRYEATMKGPDGSPSSLPFIIANSSPVTSIAFNNRVVSLLASGSITKDDVVSTLCYGVQWDQTVRFIEKNYPGISKDSTGKGNYSGTVIKTGSNEAYAQNNIYDMCGNAMEWTMEAYGSGTRVARGGYCKSNGIGTPISNRVGLSTTSTDNALGYRVALYIK